MDFGTRLLNLLEEQELTQKKFSEILYVAPSTLNAYIRGRRNVDCETLKRIAVYFRVSVDYLLGLTNVKRTPLYPPDMKKKRM